MIRGGDRGEDVILGWKCGGDECEVDDGGRARVGEMGGISNCLTKGV